MATNALLIAKNRRQISALILICISIAFDMLGRTFSLEIASALGFQDLVLFWFLHTSVTAPPQSLCLVHPDLLDL